MDENQYAERFGELKKALYAGEISEAEWGNEQQIARISLVDYFAENKKWDKLIDFTELNWQVLEYVFKNYYSEIPDDLKYGFVTSVYLHHGDGVPAVRKALRSARKYGKPDLPPEIASKDVITVYRGGMESIEECKYRISWSTSKEIAERFYNRNKLLYPHFFTYHLYQAKIRTADIIAYTDEREEKEVMQYRKVFDIEEITPTKEANAPSESI